MLHGSGGGGCTGCASVSEGYWRGGFAPAWAMMPTLRKRDSLIVVCLFSDFVPWLSFPSGVRISRRGCSRAALFVECGERAIDWMERCA